MGLFHLQFVCGCVCAFVCCIHDSGLEWRVPFEYFYDRNIFFVKAILFIYYASHSIRYYCYFLWLLLLLPLAFFVAIHFFFFYFNIEPVFE